MVSSRVLQGFGLGLALFNILVNYLKKGVHNETSKFADDTKLLQIVKS